MICSSIVDLLVVANIDVRIYLAARSQDRFKERCGSFDNIIFVDYDAIEDVPFDFHADYIVHGASLASSENILLNRLKRCWLI